MTDATERWLPVVGWEGFYEVSNAGRLRSLDRVIVRRDGRRARLKGRILKLKFIHHYNRVSLLRPGTRRDACVHRLVVEAWHGAKPDADAVVRHLNGNALDNRPENLRWGTAAENTADMFEHGNAYWVNRTECKHGHRYTDENTRIVTRGNGGTYRQCLECERRTDNVQNRRRVERRRGEAPLAECGVCGGTFRSNFKRARFCSDDCRRISRRVEFGWRRAA